MAILGALSIARSGLVATGEALGVTGNNIANVNTTAFKGSRPEFADLLGEAEHDLCWRSCQRGPVGRFGLIVSSVRATTSPSTRTTHSGLSFSAAWNTGESGSATIWVMP